MVRFDMYAQQAAHQLLKVRIPADLPFNTLFQPVFDRYLADYTLVAIETVQAGTLTELVYSLELRDPGRSPGISRRGQSTHGQQQGCADYGPARSGFVSWQCN